MKTSLEAMKMALKAFRYITLCNGVAVLDPIGLRENIESLNAAIAAEESQSVEPLTSTYVQPVPDKCDRITWRGRYYHLPELKETQSVAEDPKQKPKQPLPGEREALLSDHQELNMGNYSEIEVEELNNWANKAHAMLAADAQEIAELKSGWRQTVEAYVGVVAEWDKALAQQVKYVPVDSKLRDANWNHPSDDEPRTEACRTALKERGDDKGQGLDGYWKWGFTAGFNAAMLDCK